MNRETSVWCPSIRIRFFGPYTGTCFASESETDIEHMVALNEAHTSGMCFADTETKRTFAGDVLNLTLAHRT